MPHVLWRTLPEVGKGRQIFREREPHNELIVRPSGERDCRPYAKPSVAMVGSSIAEVIANPLSA